jgi:hypothetical protein
MRFSIFFVSLCAFVPFFTLMRESQHKGSYAFSIWWLKPAIKEDMSWTVEEDVNTGDEGKKLSRWAQQQKSIASLYSINFARGAFCRNNLAPNAHRQQQYSESSSEPLVWDASIGDRGSIVNIIVSPRKHYIDSLDSTRINLISTLPAMRRATCRLYDHRSQLLATVTSLVVLGGSLVRCPIPHELRKHAQGQEIRMGVKLVWPDLADVMRKSQTVKSSGSGVGSGIMGAFIKSNAVAEEIKVGSVIIVPKGATHTNRSLLFDSTQSSGVGDGVIPSGGRPLYPVCPLPVTAIMSDSLEYRKSMMGRGTGLGGGGGRTRGAVPYVDREEERERDWGRGTEFQVQGLRGRPAVPLGSRYEVSSASGYSCFVLLCVTVHPTVYEYHSCFVLLCVTECEYHFCLRYVFHSVFILYLLYVPSLSLPPLPSPHRHQQQQQQYQQHCRYGQHGQHYKRGISYYS